ncbi:hypothetical protein QBC34DRAFT_383316 [Podospora aff. communis PSN243]|uniref:Ankyrin n=1 Tax=Podospora aff. communis PSN243 TaxID=3040156 RepID=A0AAV9GD65_9PEZI|nr:hypothetical protein QBC34DRAFT_383316 [Podospora aff. communis PSN243]
MANATAITIPERQRLRSALLQSDVVVFRGTLEAAKQRRVDASSASQKGRPLCGHILEDLEAKHGIHVLHTALQGPNPAAMLQYVLSVDVWRGSTQKKHAFLGNVDMEGRDAFMEACRVVTPDHLGEVLGILHEAFNGRCRNAAEKEYRARNPMVDREGRSAVHIAMEERNMTALEWMHGKGCFDMKRRVEGNGVYGGRSLGHFAVLGGWIDGVKWFHERVWGEQTAWLREQDGAGSTPLRAALDTFGHRHPVYKAVYIDCMGMLADADAPDWEDPDGPAWADLDVRGIDNVGGGDLIGGGLPDLPMLVDVPPAQQLPVAAPMLPMAGQWPAQFTVPQPVQQMPAMNPQFGGQGLAHLPGPIQQPVQQMAMNPSVGEQWPAQPPVPQLPMDPSWGAYPHMQQPVQHMVPMNPPLGGPGRAYLPIQQPVQHMAAPMNPPLPFGGQGPAYPPMQQPVQQMASPMSSVGLWSPQLQGAPMGPALDGQWPGHQPQWWGND